MSWAERPGPRSLDRLSTLIADDEHWARVALAELLEGYPEVEVVGYADSVASTVKELTSKRPDLLLLDIRMPDGLGFEVFERTSVESQVVFVTAFDTHALRAFEVNALDYLLKPVAPHRLARALGRVSRAALRDRASTKQFAAKDLVSLHEGRFLRFTRIENIVLLVAADGFVEIHLECGRTALVQGRLQSWRVRLPKTFVQVRRSVIVNLSFVEEVDLSAKNPVLRLRGAREPLSMSRRYARAFRDKV